MLTEDQMSVNERRKYLKRMKERYVGAKRAERGHLLSEMEQVTGMHRKSLTRLMHAGSLERKKRTTPRPCSYGLEVERVIVRVWESRDDICAERLTPGLLEMAQHLARFEPLGLTAQVEGQLATISRATVARILRKYRSRRVRLPQKGAERANQVTKGVPLGYWRAGSLRGRPGLSQWREYSGGVWTYHSTHRCEDRLERARGGPGTRTSGDGRWLSPHCGAGAFCDPGTAS